MIAVEMHSYIVRMFLPLVSAYFLENNSNKNVKYFSLNLPAI